MVLPRPLVRSLEPSRPHSVGVMSEGVILGLMSDLWRTASEATDRFAAQAVDYDRYRPRYPDSVFDDLVGTTNLAWETG